MAKHGRSAWGSLSYDPKAKVARIRYWAEGPDGYRRRSKTLRGVSRKEAEAARAALMLDHSEDAPCPTVGQAWERWYLPARRRMVADGDMAPQTLYQYESAWRRHVCPRWGETPCDQVSALEVQKWLSGMALNAAKLSKIVMRGVLSYAVKYGHVGSNVMREDYDMPSASTVKRREGGCWDARGLTEVWRACAGTWFEAEAILCGFGGCRVGEGLSVCGGDVSEHEFGGVAVAAVEIDSQVLAQTGEDTMRTKTSGSVRVAVVAGDPARRLARLAREAGSSYLTGDGLGGPARQQAVRAAFAQRLDDAGVERHLLKNLRKSWRTVAKWDLGLPAEFCEPLMGHAVPGVTGTYYDRPDIEMLGARFARAYSAAPFADGLPWVTGAFLGQLGQIGTQNSIT